MKPALLSTLLIGLLLGVGCSPRGAPPGGFPRSPVPVTGIAYVVEQVSGERDIYLIQPDGTGRIPLIASPEVDSDPAFSPDGTMLAFRSRRDGSSDIYITAADGTGEWVNVVNDPADSFDDEFSPR